jgi:hypothetical protein
MHGPDREIEAKVEYRDGQYRVVLPGTYVVCAVTRRRISLESLRYWSVERQEAYVDAAAAMAALRGAKP